MIGQLRTTLQPDDVLGAVFALASQREGLHQFRAHDFNLQEVIHTLVSEEKYPLLVESFIFSDAGPKPFSPDLSEAMSRLQLSGLVGRENPEYITVLIKPAAKDYFEKVLRRVLSPEQIKELEKAADRFAQLMLQQAS